jgi:hypothetical protein
MLCELYDIILFSYSEVLSDEEDSGAVIWILMKDEQEEPQDYTRAQLCPPQCQCLLMMPSLLLLKI